MHSEFLAFALLPPGLRETAPAISACRCGGVGIVNAAFAEEQTILGELDRVAALGRGPFGVALRDLTPTLFERLKRHAAEQLEWIFVEGKTARLWPEELKELRSCGARIVLVVTSSRWPAGSDSDQFDGLVLKGHEAEGFVGEESAFVLLQRWLKKTDLPLYVQGGMTPETAAACASVGASGAVFVSQLLFLEELQLSEYHSQLLSTLSGSETHAVGDVETGEYFRILKRPRLSLAQSFCVEGDGLRFDELEPRLASYAHEGAFFRADESCLLPLGQDIGLARALANQYISLPRLFFGVKRALHELPRIALTCDAFAESSALAQEMGSRLPVVQGPMTRVSDSPAFATAVAQAGALPMLAFALLRGERLERILQDTASTIGGAPWGIGLLGFAPRSLLEEQIQLALRFQPAYAIVAGGRPDQIAELEKAGIKSFLHVPSAALLGLFLREGARRFIFEGRECGGHVGPLGSFVLWSSMIQKLVEELDSGLGSEKSQASIEARSVQVLFAGGVHDAPSSAMIHVMAAPLLQRGVRVGILMGSAYLFTREIVETGAIVPSFQREVLACERTVNLESGPGHASRCAYTPFAAEFFALKRSLRAENQPAEESRRTLDDLILGRLRIASKGQTRSGDGKRIESVSEDRQRAEGMYMLGQVATLRDDLVDLRQLHAEVTQGARRLVAKSTSKEPAARAPSRAQPADIAIVGLGSLLPAAQSPEEFWENILDKVDGITEVPRDRWDYRLYFDEDRTVRDKIYSKWGGFLDDLVFDPTEFGMPPRSLQAIDPMQLIALEVAKRTLRDAGYETREFDRSRASVILGASGGTGDLGTRYGLRSELPRFAGELPDELGQRLPEWTEDSFAGILNNVTAGRVANRLDFGGANFTTDAACASSLAAIYQGMAELVAGRTDFVISGGVDTVQGPFGYLCFSKTQALSPTGRCRSFDSSADGIVISEGVAMVAMKRLEDAERDGDRIYAVIKGIGASSDGRARGMTAPLPAGQLQAMRRAYEQANYGPDTVALFEAHGTGTVAGDTAELESTTTLLREAGSAQTKAIVGSVKTMIGHTKATAGAAGLLKTVLALHHRVLPPHRGVSSPNPVLLDPNCPLALLDEATPWFASAHPRRASVSAFGFGGTNFHLTLEEYDGEFRTNRQAPGRSRLRAELFLFQAESLNALKDGVEDFLKFSKERPALSARLAAAYLAKRYRSGGAALAVVARHLDDLENRLNQIPWEPICRGATSSAPNPRRVENDASSSGATLPPGVRLRVPRPNQPCKVAFLFSGQGSQYPGMCRELAVDFPVVGRCLFEANDQLRSSFEERFGQGATLSHFLYPGPTHGRAPDVDVLRLKATDVAQPALGAVDTALFRLLGSLGIAPDMVAGHSYGEFVALHAAGVYDFGTLLHLSAARGRFIVDEASREGRSLGGMVAVLAPRPLVEQAIEADRDLVLANHNAPSQCIVSGSEEALYHLMARLDAQGVRTARLPVSAAFHSPLVQPAQAKLAEEIDASPLWRPATCTVYSNTSGGPHDPDVAELKTKMAAHLTQPVEFVRQIESMYADGARVFIEVGPKSVLTRLTSKILEGREHQAVALDSESGTAGMLNALAELVALDISFDPWALFCDRVPDSEVLEAPQSPPPRHAVLVNGSGVRPLDSPPRQIGVTWEETHSRRESPSAPLSHDVATGPLVPTSVSSTAAPLAGARSPTFQPQTQSSKERSSRSMKNAPEPVFSAYFETMRQFLVTQERVMTAYLGQATRDVAMETPPPPQVHAPPEVGARVHRPIEQRPIEQRAVEQRALEQRALEQRAADELNGQVAAPAATSAVSVEKPATSTAVALPSRAELTQLLVQIVADKTGYPQEMLGLDQNLESELGIDSIKRIEIVGALLEAVPAPLQESLRPSRTLLNTQQTLDALLDIVAEPQNAPAGATNGATASVEGPRPFDPAGARKDVREERLPRYVLVATPAPLPQTPQRALTPGPFLITQDTLGLADRLQHELTARGHACLVVPQGSLDSEARLLGFLADHIDQHPVWAGVVHVAPVGCPPLEANAHPDAVRQQIFRTEKSLFLILNTLHEKLHERAHVAVLSSLGGDFGRTLSRTERHPKRLSFQGGAVGLVKSYAEERPGLRVRAADLDPSSNVATWTSLILDELSLQGGRYEVGFPAGVRTTFHTVAEDAPSERRVPQDLGPLVILATGGARGVTAEVLRDLAVPGNTLILTGRRPLPAPEPEEIAGLGTATELRDYLISQVREGNLQLTPARIAQRVRDILSARETLANIADLRARGAVVEYQQMDVTREEHVAAAVADIVQRFGPIRGIVHGAGIIEDKAVADKSSESWSRVVETKVLGLHLLQKHVADESLEFFSVFSSVAGRYGNSGQADYATANELMNRLCCQLKRRYGERTHVGAYCWGPWGPTKFGAGMVTREAEAKFAEKGVALVEANEGRKLFAREICLAAQTCVEVVFGRGPWEEREEAVARMVEATLESGRGAGCAQPLLRSGLCSSEPKGSQVIRFPIGPAHLYLNDHRLEGTPVVPVAIIAEIIAEGAAHFWPGWSVVEIRELRLLKGLEARDDSMGLALEFSPPPYGSSEGFDVDVTLRSDPSGDQPARSHYKAQVRLAQMFPEAPPLPRAPQAAFGLHTGDVSQLDAQEAYDRHLFHGARFQTLHGRIELTEQGAQSVVHITSASEWMAPSERVVESSGPSTWTIDPGVLDAAPQMAIVWARHFLGMTSLPIRFGTIRRYVDELPAKVRMVFVRLPSVDENKLFANVSFFDDRERIVLEIEELECIMSEALNRLVDASPTTASSSWGEV